MPIQSVTATGKGKAFVFGSKASVAVYPTAGGSPLFSGLTTIESYDIAQDADVEQIKDGAGVVVGQVASNQRLSMTLNIIPSADTAANALLACGVPAANGWVTISEAPAVSIGGTANAINGDWVYAGGASIKFTSSGKAMVTLPVTRYLDSGAMSGSASVSTLSA